MFYGCHLWYHRIRSRKLKSDLEHVQRIILMGITGVMRSTPTKAPEILTDTLPVKLYGESEALIAAVRLKNANCWKDSKQGHANILTEDGKQIPELLMHTGKCIPQYFFQKKCKVEIPQREDWDEENFVRETDINVYTEGSKMDEGSGIGIYCVDPQINH